MERMMGQQGQCLDVKGMDGISEAHLQISNVFTLACGHRWSCSKIPSHVWRAALANGGGSKIQAIKKHLFHLIRTPHVTDARYCSIIA